MKGIGAVFTASFNNMAKHKYSITGMHCSACSASIEKALSKVNGVTEAKVNLLSETLSVIYNDSVLDTKKIEETVTKLGFGCSDYDFHSAMKKNNKISLQLKSLIPLMEIRLT